MAVLIGEIAGFPGIGGIVRYPGKKKAARLEGEDCARRAQDHDDDKARTWLLLPTLTRARGDTLAWG